MLVEYGIMIISKQLALFVEPELVIFTKTLERRIVCINISKYLADAYQGA